VHLIIHYIIKSGTK